MTRKRRYFRAIASGYSSERTRNNMINTVVLPRGAADYALPRYFASRIYLAPWRLGGLSVRHLCTVWMQFSQLIAHSKSNGGRCLFRSVANPTEFPGSGQSHFSLTSNQCRSITPAKGTM